MKATTNKTARPILIEVNSTEYKKLKRLGKELNLKPGPFAERQIKKFLAGVDPHQKRNQIKSTTLTN
jgi:hypothetical protein